MTQVDTDDILELVGILCDSVGVKKYDIFKFENNKNMVQINKNQTEMTNFKI